MNRKNNITTTVAELANAKYSLYVPVKSGDTKSFIPVTAKQLSKGVLTCNRRDEVIVDKDYGRNGSKAAYVVEIPRN